jgi:SET domain/MYND finger
MSDPSYKIFYNLKASHKFNYCHHCLNDNLLDLVPCLNCRSTMYCGEKCKQSAHSYHSYECKFAGKLQESGNLYMTLQPFFQALAIVDGSFEELDKLSQKCEKTPKTIFDFDFSNPKDPEYQKNRLRASMSLARKKKQEEFPFFDYIEILFSLSPDLSQLWSSHEKIIRKVIQHIYDVQQLAMCPIERFPVNMQSAEKVGRGNFLFGGLFNHSCTPNAAQFLVNDKNVMRIVKPVAKGEQLFDSYIETFEVLPKIQRQMKLQFKCECEACRDPKRFPLYNQLEIRNHKLYNFAFWEVKLDYNSMERKQIITKANFSKKTLQKIYSEKEFPSQEYFLLGDCLAKCFAALASRHKLFMK